MPGIHGEKNAAGSLHINNFYNQFSDNLNSGLFYFAEPHPPPILTRFFLVYIIV